MKVVRVHLTPQNSDRPLRHLEVQLQTLLMTSSGRYFDLWASFLVLAAVVFRYYLDWTDIWGATFRHPLTLNCDLCSHLKLYRINLIPTPWFQDFCMNTLCPVSILLVEMFEILISGVQMMYFEAPHHLSPMDRLHLLCISVITKQKNHRKEGQRRE